MHGRSCMQSCLVGIMALFFWVSVEASTSLSTTKGSRSLKEETPSPSQPATPSKIDSEAKKPSLEEAKAIYFHPGVVANLNGLWQGGDQLLNLPKEVSLSLSLLKPSDVSLNLSEETLRTQAQELFRKSGLSTKALTLPNSPPLPFFHLEIWVYPIERGFVTFCQARLFESVTLNRFHLEANTAFQAITWEKQLLQIVPSAELLSTLSRSIETLIASYTERYFIFNKK